MKTLLMWILLVIVLGAFAKASHLWRNQYPRAITHRDDVISLVENFSWIIAIVLVLWGAK